MAKEPPPVAENTTAPTNTMSYEELFQVTDNMNKLMGKTWYGAATIGQPQTNDVFWEHWSWETKDGLKAENKEWASNDTFSRVHPDYQPDESKREEHYPTWWYLFRRNTSWNPLSACMGAQSYDDKPYFAVRPSLTESIAMPVVMDILPVVYSEADGVFVYYIEALGKTLYFFFHKEPLINPALYEKYVNIMEQKHGVDKKWWNKVLWDPNYKKGDTDEPSGRP
mmetsp:Transcript_23206/g.41920  ORF Transcript_23206/g.41920 Transcript_23206/m.41920 type:complete len:224 (+) Transcript_23206:69-740(+)